MEKRCDEICPDGWAEGERCILADGHGRNSALGPPVHEAKALEGENQGTSWIRGGDWANCFSGRFRAPALPEKEELERLRAEKKQLYTALRKLFEATSHKGIPKFGSVLAIYEEVLDALKLGEE